LFDIGIIIESAHQLAIYEQVFAKESNSLRNFYLLHSEGILIPTDIQSARKTG